MNREEAAHIVDVAFGIPQAVRRIGEDRTYHEDEIREAKNMAIKALEQIPDLKDVYDKGYKDGQKALAVHLELCKEEGNCDYYDSYNQTCRRSDVPKEPCEDCISREEVCDYIAEFVNHEYATDREREMVEHIIGGIQHLPSIQPKPKIGRWIADVDRWGEIVTTVNGYRCSECNIFNTDKDNYCPQCGAKMSEIPTDSEKAVSE